MIHKIFNRVLLILTKVSSTERFQIFDGEWNVDRALFLTSSVARLATTVETGKPITVPKICL